MLVVVLNNFKVFMITWGIILLVNQIFIFGACFAPYCLLAALPHTGIIAAVFTYFSIKTENDKHLTESEKMLRDIDNKQKIEALWNDGWTIIGKFINYLIYLVIIGFILYAIVTKLYNSFQEKTTETSSRTTIVNTPKYKTSSKAHGLYSLKVITNPANARVQIMNVKPKYYHGIKLKKGRYNIRVSKPGYITGNYTVDHYQDTDYEGISLQKKVAKSKHNNFQIQRKGSRLIYKIVDKNPCYITYKNSMFHSNTCSNHTNSKGMRIYCTKSKKVCKTAQEIRLALDRQL